MVDVVALRELAARQDPEATLVARSGFAEWEAVVQVRRVGEGYSVLKTITKPTLADVFLKLYQMDTAPNTRALVLEGLRYRAKLRYRRPEFQQAYSRFHEAASERKEKCSADGSAQTKAAK